MGYPGTSGIERLVGVEMGLNFKQILDDLNIRRNTRWLRPARGVRQLPVPVHRGGPSIRHEPRALARAEREQLGRSSECATPSTAQEASRDSTLAISGRSMQAGAPRRMT